MDRRTLLIGGGALAVVAAGAGYYFTQGGSTDGGQQAGSSGSSEPLMVAGPLGEKILGDANAPVTIIEYASMTCGHCANFHNQTLPALKADYIETGKVNLYFREFPLDPVATAAFMIARCADEEAYFPLVDAMFQLQGNWARSQNPIDGLQRIAQQAGFSQEQFQACLQNQSVLDGVNWVKERASAEFGVQSTPHFFVNGEDVRGNLPLTQFREMLDPLVS